MNKDQVIDKPTSGECKREENTMKLKNKIAIITGGARGIGRAMAERFADEGAQVVIADILLEEATQTAATIGRQAFAVELDVTQQASIHATWSKRLSNGPARLIF